MPESTATLFGIRMKAARTALGMSAEDIVTRSGLNHTNHVYRYESGRNEPSLENAARVAKALGVSLDYLTGLSDDAAHIEHRLVILRQIEELKAQLS